MRCFRRRIITHIGLTMLLSFSTFACSLIPLAAQEEKRIEVFPENVKVRVGQTYMFRATGYDCDNQPVSFSPLWHVTEGGTIDKSGMFRATSKGTCTVTAKDSTSKHFGTAKVVIVEGRQSSGQTKEDVVSIGVGRISVTKWNIGKGNMFKAKGSFVAQVFGKNAAEIKLYGIEAFGKFQEIQVFSCKDESIVNFNFKYDRFDIKYFELILYDNSGKVIARDNRQIWNRSNCVPVTREHS